MKNAMKLLAPMLYVLLLLFACSKAGAQGLYSCAAQPCTVESDPFPTTGVQPTACRLRDGGVQLEETPVVQAGGGAVKCQFIRSFALGIHTLTATAIAADGAESPSSAPFVFTSSAGAPPAPVLRIVPPASVFTPADGGTSRQRAAPSGRPYPNAGR